MTGKPPRLWMLLTPWKWPTRKGRLLGFYAWLYTFVIIGTLIFPSRWLSLFLSGMAVSWLLILIIDSVAFHRELQRLRREQDRVMNALQQLTNDEITIDQLPGELQEEIALLRARAYINRPEFPYE